MVKYKRNLLSVALASATLWMASAQAQEQPATDQQADQADTTAVKKQAAKPDDATKLDRVVVTGIRRGIEDAIETKQAATSIVESVSAEDIGKLPDSSIAESIARLPGLTAQRERGRATQINIRGLSGDFAGTTLNGREQTSTSDNRGVEFDQFPSELMSGVVVYKTPNASLIGQGLSGTIDMKTVRPLAFGERVMSANYRADQNRVNGEKDYGNRYSFSYIDQFLDRTLGVAIGYAHLNSPAPGFQNEAWGYADGPPGTGTKVYGGGKLYKFDDNNKRDGLMATLQYKPNDFWESTLDAFYSRFQKTEIKSGVEFGTAWGQGQLQPGYTANANGTITDSTWTNVKPVVRMDSNPIDDHLHSIGWANKFTLNEHWTLDTDLSVSNTKRNFRVLETYAGLTGDGTTTVRVQLDPSGAYNQLTFGSDFGDPNNLRLIDAGGWGQDGYVKDFEVTDRLKALRLDATRSFDSGFLSSIAFGVNRSDRTKEKSSLEAKLCIDACAGVGDSAPFPGATSSFNFGGLDTLAVYDANDLLNSGFYNLQPKYHRDIANKNWTVDETVDTFYAQANIDTDLGSRALRGNVGVQYVRVDQGSTGFNTFAGNDAGTMEERGASYGDFLPSLNLALEVSPDTYLRFAAARQMQRPRMDDMRASFDVNINTGVCGGQSAVIWCGSGGNPELKPWMANAYDLSAEKYFTTDAGNKGYVSVAYFFKDLKTYIYKQDRAFDYAGFALPPPDPNAPYPATTMGSINQPANGDGGLIAGTELTVSVPLDLVWAPLNGFGVQASYSDTRTSIHPNGPGTSDPLPGFSRYVSNVTAYYERNGFSVRVSQRKRSPFRGETRGFGADLTFVDYQAETVQDAQVNYSFNHGPLQGLALYLQMSNIGDEPSRTADAADPGARPVQYFEYGRTTLLGFSYKF
jgi:iron complex outermembrane receptor protein